MKRWPRLVPTPGAFAAALALALFSGALAFGAGTLIAAAAMVGRHSVRLAALFAFAAIVSPIPTTAFAHHVTSRVLDWIAPSVGERRAPFATASRGFTPGLLSWWAGAYCWFAIVMATLLTAFTFAIVSPPEVPRLPDVLAATATAPAAAAAFLTLPGIVWLVYAAYLFHFSGLVERRLRTGE